MRVESLSGIDAIPRLDIAIDGADQVDPSGWLVREAPAHTREGGRRGSVFASS
jgi:ribose 5-phosphate isomerase